MFLRIAIIYGFLFRLICFIPLFSQAQSKGVNTYEVRIISFIEESRKMPFEEAMIHLEKAEKTAEKHFDTENLALVLNEEGYRARKENKFIEAIKYHGRALSLLENSKDTLLKINVLINLATDLRKVNFEERAYHYLVQAMELSEKTNNEANLARALHGIGNIHINLQEYDKALGYFYKTLAIEKKRKNKRGMDYVYSNLAEVYTLTKQFDSAQKYLSLTLELSKKLYGDNLGIKYNIAGHYFYYRKNYPKALEYFQKALEDTRRRNIERYAANSEIMMGKIYMHDGNNDRALNHIQAGLNLAKKIHSKENIVLGYDALIDLYSHTGDYKKALEYAKLKEVWKNNLLNNQTKQSIHVLEVLHKMKEKDKKLTSLALQQKKLEQKAKFSFYLWLITLISSVLGIALIVVFYKLRQKKIELELEEKNQQILSLIRKEQIESKKNQPLKMNTESSEEEDACNKFLAHEELTNREKEILQLICQGKNNKEIARELYISLNTVKTHIRHIYDKLNVKNRLDLLKQTDN